MKTLTPLSCERFGHDICVQHLLGNKMGASSSTEVLRVQLLDYHGLFGPERMAIRTCYGDLNLPKDLVPGVTDDTEVLLGTADFPFSNEIDLYFIPGIVRITSGVGTYSMHLKNICETKAVVE